MGERKVVSKYIPADFDPSLVPKGKKLSSKDGTVPVRMMLPFSIQCTTCQTFLYRGRKFNSKKEAMGGPNGKYLGITRWRFYIKCTSCARPITFCTDPQNADYEMESGGTRNYEVYKDQAKTEEEATTQNEKEEKEDPMKALENRVLDSQREMADYDNLEAIKAMNARHVKLMGTVGGTKSGGASSGKGGGGIMSMEELLDQKHGPSNDQHDDKDIAVDKDQIELTEEDEALIKSIRFGRQQNQKMKTHEVVQSTGNNIHRLDESDEIRIEQERQAMAKQLEEQMRLQQLQQQQQQQAKKKANLPMIKVVKKKRKRPEDVCASEATTTTTTTCQPKQVTNASNNTKTTKSDDDNGTNNNSNNEDTRASAPSTSTTAFASGTTATNGLAGLLGGYSSSSSDGD